MHPREEKVRVITQINDILMRYRVEPLTPDDFDNLYELSLKELMEVETSLIKETVRETAR